MPNGRKLKWMDTILSRRPAGILYKQVVTFSLPGHFLNEKKQFVSSDLEKLLCPPEFKLWERARLGMKSNLALISSLITASATKCGGWYSALRGDFQIEDSLLQYHTCPSVNDGPGI